MTPKEIRAKKLSGLDVKVASIKPGARKKLEKLVLAAKHEISEWRKFLRDCEKKLK